MDQDDRKKLIAAVRRRLTSSKAAQHVKELASVILLDANMEDLADYSIADTAAFVQSTADLIARRKPGKHKVQLTNFEVAGQPARQGDITLVEILNDNMPFIVDSVVGELEDLGAEIRLVIHPVIVVERDADGKLKRFRGGLAQNKSDAGTRESLIHIHIARIHDADEITSLTRKLDGLLTEVRRAVTDWRAMRGRLEQAIDDYRFGAAGFADEDREEAIAFLNWLLDDNFTLLGIREYDFVGGRRRGQLKRRDKTGLGILGDPNIRVLRRGDKVYTTTPAIREFLMRPEPLFVTKANIRSRVHRRAYMDYVGVKLHDQTGRLTGELRVIGLFTSTAYNRSTRTIPYLRQKTQRVLTLAGFDPHGHSGKALFNVLESYPRDELFHIDDQTLHDFAIAILELHQRPRVRVLVRPDRFGRYVSVIVYVPRERYNTTVRVAIGEHLAKRFDGHVSAYRPAYPEAMILAQVHFIIGRDDDQTPDFDQGELEAEVADLTRTWSDHLRLRLQEDATAQARADIDKYENAFPASYRDAFSPEVAMADIAVFNGLGEDAPLAVEFHALTTPRDHEIGLKLIHRGAPLNLSERVPILENMGFGVVAEQTYEITPAGDGTRFYVHDMILNPANGTTVDLARLQQPLTDCLLAVWHRRAENDGFNSLVLIADLPWRKVALIRAFGRYLHQTDTPYSQRSMWETLRRYPALAKNLVALFQARFDPDAQDEKTARAAARRVAKGLEQVETLEEDRVVRRFAALLEALLRTNFYMTDSDGVARTEIVFKFDSRAIDFLPEPRPYREIYVYAPRVEGVHLRFGEVARGGLRWSDRAQDYRTEVLGLVKAQQVKNAVIVPVGAKGGFVAKWLKPGMTREDFLAEGQAAYRIFVTSLLDITDNLDGEKVAPPPQVVRHDGDDPYLVVAADKGTATFSDIANGIALEHGFWLGDAFASGGSVGYDHKKMGITARGAWEAVKRHFREMDIDIQTTAFSAVGVGDMSGDVFGNGMLLSSATRLVAAFDHRDIFIDPDPDPAASFAERKRLFETPRSSWQDYDRDLISTGGGVFSRREKSITLSREIRDLLGLSGSRATPNEVMRAILSADVDLLWFGGVGTFVKGPDERDDDVGDRANDALRITADMVRASVVGEGANLGFTQRARIAYGLAGGRCNSDAIDNSAGVNTSDIEVNIKIALGAAVRDGRLTLPRRNQLLKSMTRDVARLALANNYGQTLAISLSQRSGMHAFGYQQRFMQTLDRAGRLDREVEILPDDVAMSERHAAGIPLSRAELGVLLAYAKITLFEDLLASDLADDPYLVDELMQYFPAKMQSTFADTIEHHRLRREIVVTSLSNAMVNHCGSTFVMQMADRTGADPAEVTRAYVVAREAFSLQAFNAEIDALDNALTGEVQLALYQASRSLAHNSTVWFLENTSFHEGVQPVIDTFRPSVRKLAADLDGVLPARLAASVAQAAEALQEDGVPADLAHRTARLPVLADAVDIDVAARAAGSDLMTAARVFFEVGERFRIARIQEQAGALALTDYYDGLAMERAVEVLGATHRRLTQSILATGTGDDAVEAWLAAAGKAAGRTLDAVSAITEAEDLTVSRLSVASGLLADFCRDRERT